MAEQAAGTEGRKPRKELGAQRMAESAIPDGIRNAAISKLGEDVNVQPAREDGSYKGKIAYANDRYLVQAVGKDGKSAVVHQRSDVELVGQKIQWRAENGKLTNADVQIHYDGQSAKGYVWNREREQAARAERAAGASKDQAGAQKSVPADRSKPEGRQDAEQGADGRKAGAGRAAQSAGDRKPDIAAERSNSRGSAQKSAPTPAKAADKADGPKARAPRAPARQRQSERQQVASGLER